MSDTSLNTTGDPETPGSKIKPPTVNQPASSESDAGIKPPTASDTAEDNPPTDFGADPPIIVDGGGKAG
jgi:hypothetical protein